MYSHKRSFTGQSSRSFSALFDIPFLVGAAIINSFFSVIHSIVTYNKLEENVGNLPHALKNVPQAEVIATLKNSVSSTDLNLIFATWFGLTLPLLLISIAVRWTLGALRVSVQRSVTLCCLFTFYFCSFMTVALHNPEWTPGNFLVRLFHSFGDDFFESLRAILCICLGIACLYTLAKNATSKLNRSLRLTVAGIVIISLLMADFINSKKTRTIHESFFKSPSNANFIFIIPGLTTENTRLALLEEEITPTKEQLTSFQEIHPTTPSLLGQLVTSLHGLEPNAHGIRHDFMDEEIVAVFKNSLKKRNLQGASDFFVTAVGGPTPLSALFDHTVPGSRCGQTPAEIAKLGHFQASVIPYSLSPRLIESYLHPELICSNRFLTVDQHLFMTYHRVISQLHEPGNKTFLVWVSNSLGVEKKDNLKEPKPEWSNQTNLIYSILSNHQSFLQSANLLNHHRTFLVGLAEGQSQTTAFARFDGETKSTLTDLTLESPGQRGQSSVAELLRGQSPQEEKDSTYFYSEFNLQTENNIAEIPPSIVTQNSQIHTPKIVLNDSALRKAVFKIRRHVICQNVASETGKRLLVKVSLNLRPFENRVPELGYEDIEKTNLPPHDEPLALEECLKNARDQLIRSVVQDVTLRDSSAFKTMLAGLPIKSVKTSTATDEHLEEFDETLDESTSALPDSSKEENE